MDAADLVGKRGQRLRRLRRSRRARPGRLSQPACGAAWPAPAVQERRAERDARCGQRDDPESERRASWRVACGFCRRRSRNFSFGSTGSSSIVARARYFLPAPAASLTTAPRNAFCCGMDRRRAGLGRGQSGGPRGDFGSQRRLADALGVSPAQVSRWTRGQGIDPECRAPRPARARDVVPAARVRAGDGGTVALWRQPAAPNRRPIDLIRLGRDRRSSYRRFARSAPARTRDPAPLLSPGTRGRRRAAPGRALLVPARAPGRGPARRAASATAALYVSEEPRVRRRGGAGALRGELVLGVSTCAAAAAARARRRSGSPSRPCRRPRCRGACSRPRRCGRRRGHR